MILTKAHKRGFIALLKKANKYADQNVVSKQAVHGWCRYGILTLIIGNMVNLCSYNSI